MVEKRDIKQELNEEMLKYYQRQNKLLKISKEVSKAIGKEIREIIKEKEEKRKWKKKKKIYGIK